ncbi:DHS-like NAD/FAD-binding domain-containing protein [Tirmania nivea]|nr:DHS-like NAD/FAD-binding domain-containing protein [Tirmania nivea]
MGNDLSAIDNRSTFDDSVTPRTLAKRTVSAVADYIRSGHVNKVVFMVGAGVSTSAGIPDFRSPDTGLYANLAKLNLPYPEAVFDIGFFHKNPIPFFTLAKELYPGEIRPTIAHSFMKLLCDKGIVSQIFTQNIDCLERVAGIPSHLITEAHGSFATHTCTKCKADYPDELMKENVEKLEIPHCNTPQCNGVVKPDIVFFGESLPPRFFQHMSKVDEADLVIIMGTSLQVMPFAVLPQRAREETPRVLVNLERVGGIGSRRDDVLMIGDCDSGVRRLAKYLGWLDDLEELWAKTDPDRKVDKGKKKQKQGAYDGPMDMDEILKAQVESLTRDVEKNLKLADNHMNSVSHQLKIDQERRNTVPLIREIPQGDRRGSSPNSEHMATQAMRTMTAISPTETTTEGHPPILNAIHNTSTGESARVVDKGKGRATDESTSEAANVAVGIEKAQDETTATPPSSSL